MRAHVGPGVMGPVAGLDSNHWQSGIIQDRLVSLLVRTVTSGLLSDASHLCFEEYLFLRADFRHIQYA